MKRLPFSKPGTFRKGNIHTHSTASDGELAPEEVCRRYRDGGYDFLAITDHFLDQFDYPIVDTCPFRTDNFTTIIGAELHAPIADSAMKWDIVALDLPLDFAPWQEGETGPQIAARAGRLGPRWRAQCWVAWWRARARRRRRWSSPRVKRIRISRP